MTARLTRNDCEGSYAVVGTDDAMLWNDSEEDENIKSVRNMMAVIVKIHSNSDW